MEALAGAGTFDYVLRYRWNRDTAKGVAIGVVVCALMALIPAPLWARILVIGFSGSYVLLLLAACVLRTTALRLDENGVLVRRSWLRPQRTEFYPWGTIQGLVIWSSRYVRSVGVHCQDGVTPLVRPPNVVTRRFLAADAAGIPPGVAVTAVTISKGLLDTAALIAAVEHFAPSVHVVDLSAGRLLRQGRPA